MPLPTLPNPTGPIAAKLTRLNHRRLKATSGLAGGLSLLASAAWVQAAGPTGALNDTGATQCYDGSSLATCSSANSGDSATYPRQDARFGRDPAAGNPAISGYSKPATPASGGHGGFAFTRICRSGEAAGTGRCPASPEPGSGPNEWGCTWDRVTNLIWELKTDNASADLQDKDWTYQWGATTGGTHCYNNGPDCNTDHYITALNAANVCPVSGAGDWRLPTRRELLSLVDRGRTTSPVIDNGYFPYTVDNYYWSSDLYVPNPSHAWDVSFYNGITMDYTQTYSDSVRLVRSGP